MYVKSYFMHSTPNQECYNYRAIKKCSTSWSLICSRFSRKALYSMPCNKDRWSFFLSKRWPQMYQGRGKTRHSTDNKFHLSHFRKKMIFFPWTTYPVYFHKVESREGSPYLRDKEVVPFIFQKQSERWKKIDSDQGLH